MKRKRAHEVGSLQAKLNALWPDEVQQALERERKGEQILLSETLSLLALVFGALRESGAAVAEAERPDMWLRVTIVGGELRVTRCRQVGDKEELELVGKLGWR